VIGGMLAASFIAIFVIPAMFYLVEKFSSRKEHKGAKPPAIETTAPSPPAEATET
jgi:hydrophobic/amphiphilic exporter-1 (mainly G- bacteria), HAE1 family